MAAETVFVLGSGGSIFEMDVPVDGHRRDLYEQQIEKGELVVLAPERVRWVEEVYGTDARDKTPLTSRRLVLVVAGDGDESVPPPKAPSKTEMAAVAESLGIKVGKTWSMTKIEQAIAAKQNETPGPDEAAERAELLQVAEDLGIEVDPTLPLEDLRSAIGA